MKKRLGSTESTQYCKISELKFVFFKDKKNLEMGEKIDIYYFKMTFFIFFGGEIFDGGGKTASS